MAKTQPVVHNAENIINNKTKDTVWTIQDSQTFKLKFETSEDYIGIGANENAYTVAYKDGNDLVLVTNFLIKKNNSVKSVKNTIKDYFESNGVDVKFYNPTGDTYVSLLNADVLSYASGVAVSAAAGYYTAEERKTKLFGSKKADTYDLFNSSTADDNRGVVYDEAGNDKYIAYGGYYNVDDFSGNDKYNVYLATLKINDYAGNDNYQTKNALVDITDMAGNDSYDLSLYNVNSHVTDSKGNDKYLIADSNNYLSINDYAGNDKYEILNAKVHIYEHDGTLNPANKSGNDVYNIYGSDNLRIDEKSSNSGNDTYNITLSNAGCTIDAAGNDKYNIKFNKNFEFEDKAGNDKWNIVSSWVVVDYDINDESGIIDDKGNDSYNMDASSVKIIDKSGKDKYIFTNDSDGSCVVDRDDNDTYLVEDSRDIRINDLGRSNDKYTFKNVNNINSTFGVALDNGGNDIYNIIDTKNMCVNEKSATMQSVAKKDKNTFNIKNSARFNISVNEGYTPGNSITMFSSIDTYNITSSSGSINDYDEQNDTYNVDKLNGGLKLLDGGGDKDKLVISKAKADNLVFMASHKWNDGYTGHSNDYTLYIYDTENQGYVSIDNWFSDDTTDAAKLADGNTGIIESIKAGAKEINGLITSASTFNDKIGPVATWLNTGAHQYHSIGEVLDSNDGEAIQSLIAQFTN